MAKSWPGNTNVSNARIRCVTRKVHIEGRQTSGIPTTSPIGKMTPRTAPGCPDRPHGGGPRSQQAHHRKDRRAGSKIRASLGRQARTSLCSDLLMRSESEPTELVSQASSGTPPLHEATRIHAPTLRKILCSILKRASKTPSSHRGGRAATQRRKPSHHQPTLTKRTPGSSCSSETHSRSCYNMVPAAHLIAHQHPTR